MKLSRRLIPAFAMLLVSAVLMSTASFAWFSINSEVTAQGMQVKAAADSSLVIMGSNDTYFSNVGTVKAADALKTLKPVTSADGVNFGKLADFIEVLRSGDASANWGIYTPDNKETDENEEKFEPTTEFQSNNLVTVVEGTDEFDDYVSVTTFDIKNMGYDAEIFVSDITIAQSEASKTAQLDGKLLSTLRVAVKIFDSEGTQVGATRVFNPNNGQLLKVGNAGVAGKYVTNAWTLAAPTYTVEGAKTTNDIIATISGNTVYEVRVYLWIEGQDAACTSDFADLSVFDVTVMLGAEAKSATENKPVEDPEAPSGT